jgi:hypothetical protein
LIAVNALAAGLRPEADAAVPVGACRSVAGFVVLQPFRNSGGFLICIKSNAAHRP